MNHLLQLDSPELAQLFAEEFAQLWGDGPGGQPDSRFGLGKHSRRLQQAQLGSDRAGVLFAPHRRDDPDHGLELIRQQLEQAQRSIDLALFVFSAQELADVLALKRDQGVQIRVLVDPGFAHRSYSEWLDLKGLAMADHRCRLEAGNNPWETPLGRGHPAPRPRRQAAPQVRRDRWQNRDHRQLQLEPSGCPHQR